MQVELPSGKVMMEKCVEREVILIDRRLTRAKMIKTMQEFVNLKLEKQVLASSSCLKAQVVASLKNYFRRHWIRIIHHLDLDLGGL